jgi:amidase
MNSANITKLNSRAIFMSISSSNQSFQHAFCGDVLGTDDAVSLAQKLRGDEISSDELSKAALARAKLINPSICAINYLLTEEQIFNESLKVKNHQKITSDAFFFHGIPSFLKDNVAYKGMPTSFGSNAFSPKIEKKHSPYTNQFCSTGLRVLGKSALPEFGFNASTEPAHKEATKNPWNLNFSSGASSGGTAALVAAGVVPFAHGNDGGGSIRIPAACCGLVGLKPSRGRHVNEYVSRSLPINIVSEGILSRSVRDTAYYHFEAQKVYQNPELPPLPLVTEAGSKRLRIACYVDSVTGYSTDKETRDTCLRTADILAKAGHQVDEIRFPVSAQFSDDFTIYWGMLAYIVQKTGRLSLSKKFDKQKLDALSTGLANHYRKQMYKTPFMISRLKKHALQFQAPFETYDLYLSPVLGQSPRPLGELNPSQSFDSLLDRIIRYVSFTPMANIAGTPAIAIPAGQTAQGLPIGIQLSGRLGAEQTLLEVAFELEELQPWKFLFDKV